MVTASLAGGRAVLRVFLPKSAKTDENDQMAMPASLWTASHSASVTG
jgi:hypothetical protein